MDKKSYLLGLSMGICLCIFSILIYSNIFNLEILDNDRYEIEKLKMENSKLKSEAIINKDDKKEIKKNNDEKAKQEIADEKETPESTDREKVTIELEDNMSNEKIADLLIKNGVYKHRNDLLMIMEMLNFNKNKYADILNAYGTIKNPYYLSEALSQINDNVYMVTETLYKAGFVQDPKAFMKVLYLLRNDSKIKYGKKEFTKDSSLREICDILIT